MNKTELIQELVTKTGFTKKDTEIFLATFTETITDSLKNKVPVQITGFGTFSVTEREEREGFNPAKREVTTFPASTAPKFKAGKSLKDAVNNK